jgi:hypothetical protein
MQKTKTNVIDLLVTIVKLFLYFAIFVVFFTMVFLLDFILVWVLVFLVAIIAIIYYLENRRGTDSEPYEEIVSTTHGERQMMYGGYPPGATIDRKNFPELKEKKERYRHY